MVVVAHSSGNNRGITTTTTTSTYTSNFGGTSSASPLGAGVVALMLEANPALDWRDVQGVLIESARKNHPSDPDWSVKVVPVAVNVIQHPLPTSLRCWKLGQAININLHQLPYVREAWRSSYVSIPTIKKRAWLKTSSILHKKKQTPFQPLLLEHS